MGEREVHLVRSSCLCYENCAFLGNPPRPLPNTCFARYPWLVPLPMYTDYTVSWSVGLLLLGWQRLCCCSVSGRSPPCLDHGFYAKEQADSVRAVPLRMLSQGRTDRLPPPCATPLPGVLISLAVYRSLSLIQAIGQYGI